MGLDWDRLVQERNAWVSYNFPNHTGDDPALGSVFGVVEELGELTHHHLKEDQQIRGNTEFHRRETQDAVGDCTIYLLGVMEHYDVRPGMYHMNSSFPTTHQKLLKLTAWVGKLADNQSLWKSHIASQVAVDGIVTFLWAYCEERGWNYEEIVLKTWATVKMRDWIKYPDTGLPPQEELSGVRGEQF